MKRIIILMLAILICVSAVACSDSTDDPADTTTATGGNNQDTTNGTDTRPGDDTDIPNYLDSLPSTKYNTDFNILVRTNKLWEMDADDILGETLNDAVYNRNLAVSEKYAINLNILDTAGDYSNRENFKKEVATAVLSEDQCPYDLIASYMAYIPTLCTEGYFTNLNEIDTLDVENVWWSKSSIENNNINGKLYFAVGDICLTMWDGLFSVFFNKDLATDYGIPDLYKTVTDKQWTYEKMFEYANQIYEERDGDGLASDGDLFGMTTYFTAVRPMVYSLGMKICEFKDDGTAIMTWANEKYYDIYSKLYNNLIDNNHIRYTFEDVATPYTIFSENRALFYSARNWDAERLRQLEVNFGIIPAPMYDEAQGEYISCTDDACSMFSILVNARDYEMSGEILEGLCAETAYSVIPQYYDTLLKYRNTNDPESADMLDLLRETLYIDFGYAHHIAIGNNGSSTSPFVYTTSCLGSNTASVGGGMKALNLVWQRSLNNLVDIYAGLDD